MELQKAYKLDQSNPRILEPLAEAALDTGSEKYQSAAYFLTTRAMAVRTSKKAPYLFARAALETGHVTQAWGAVNRLLSTDPNDAEALYLMYGVQKLLGHKDADHYLVQALKINPKVTNEYRLYLNQKPVIEQGSLKNIDSLKK
jgi:Tfp pilus assembly protein PilF